MDIEEYRRRVGKTDPMYATRDTAGNRFNAASERIEPDGDYMKGYRIGEVIGRREGRRHTDRALGIGVVVGFGMGIVVAWATLGWLTP